MDKRDTLKQPLVSIIVITYNSSKYVLETLESAKAQTYRIIELIVSDDCSTDNTVDLCRKWIAENQNRFVRTRIVVSRENTGIAGNCNRGLKESRGEWLKFIAGDDFLLPECISANVDFAKKNNGEFVFSKMRILEKRKIYEPEFLKVKQVVGKYSQKKQIQEMLRLDFVVTPSVFLHQKLIVRNGCFDESIPMMEDTPMWLKLLLNNTVFLFLDQYTVVHREIPTSVSSYRRNINIKFHNSRKIFFEKIWGKELLIHGMYFYYIHHLVSLKYWDLVIRKGNDARNLACYEKWIKALSPIWWKIKFFSIIRRLNSFQINP